jgi:hypothetical protein
MTLSSTLLEGAPCTQKAAPYAKHYLLHRLLHSPRLMTIFVHRLLLQNVCACLLHLLFSELFVHPLLLRSFTFTLLHASWTLLD